MENNALNTPKKQKMSSDHKQKLREHIMRLEEESGWSRKNRDEEIERERETEQTDQQTTLTEQTEEQQTSTGITDQQTADELAQRNAHKYSKNYSEMSRQLMALKSHHRLLSRHGI